jgi:hypothetical protein
MRISCELLVPARPGLELERDILLHALEICSIVQEARMPEGGDPSPLDRNELGFAAAKRADQREAQKRQPRSVLRGISHRRFVPSLTLPGWVPRLQGGANHPEAVA